MQPFENARGGVHTVLTGTHPNSVPLIVWGYWYSTKTTLFFVFHSDAGSTHPGKPYNMKYTDDHGNVCVHLVDHPDVMSHFFADSNLVDKHNQVQQDELGLEKCWVMIDPYFWLSTTICSIHVVDCWKLAVYHKLIMQDETGISKFTGILGSSLSNWQTHLICSTMVFASSLQWSQLRRGALTTLLLFLVLPFFP